MSAASPIRPRVPADDLAPAGSRAWPWLLAAAVPVFLVYLGANTIWEANEAFYVDTPQRMVETGDYVTPYFNGLPRLNKPVLSYWIVAALYHLLGVSVTVERVGIALGALGIIGSAFLIGRALRSPATGALAALIVATSPRVVMWSRRIFIDIYITLFMSLALACFVLAERYPAHRRRWLVAMYVAIGLGVLTKGPIAVFFPVVVCALWMTIERRWSEWRTLMLGPGALIVLAIVCPWYVALYSVHGWDPIVQFFVGENVERFAAPESPEGRSIVFYLPVLLTDLFPWAPLVLISLVSGWRRRVAGETAAHASLRRLLWLWIVTIVGVFSFSQSKQDLYIFPVVAAVAALIADTIETAIENGASATTVRRILIAVSVMIVAAAGAGYWLFSAGYFALAGTGLAAACLIAGALVVVVLCVRDRVKGAVTALAVTFIAFNYVFVACIVPSMERLKPVAGFAEVMRARGGANGNFGYYHFSLPSLAHYVGRPVVEIGTVEHARAFFFNDYGAWVVMNEERFNELRQVIPGLCELARHPMFAATLSDLIARRAPKDVLLVSNRGCGAALSR